MTWQKYLKELNLRLLISVHMDDSELENATELMKQKYPGNYQLIEKYDTVSGKFVLKLEFSDPYEESIWLLKNS